jgi:hypothetical protein
MFVKFSEFAPHALFCKFALHALFCKFAPHALFCKFAPHALKGQKLLAQGNALGINSSQQGAL